VGLGGQARCAHTQRGAAHLLIRQAQRQWVRRDSTDSGRMWYVVRGTDWGAWTIGHPHRLPHGPTAIRDGSLERLAVCLQAVAAAQLRLVGKRARDHSARTARTADRRPRGQASSEWRPHPPRARPVPRVSGGGGLIAPLRSRSCRRPPASPSPPCPPPCQSRGRTCAPSGRWRRRAAEPSRPPPCPTADRDC